MKILLVGAGGYGARYVTELLNSKRDDIVFEGIVDPFLQSSREYANICAAKIPAYNTMEEFYAEHSADLAIICTPIFLHCEQSVTALKHGSYVLCEKPVAPTLEEAELMLEAERKYGRFIAIGYQWSFSDAILDLKRDILGGVLGKPISMKNIVCWPRDLSYYGRGGGWAGKIEREGRLVLDSIASNACAHYLHNMLFLLGATMDECARATEVYADCLRANDIETFDTCTIRAYASGTPIFLAASHATDKGRDPEFIFEFEKATVTYFDNDEVGIRAVFVSGEEKCYGKPVKPNNFEKLWNTVDAVIEGKVPLCTVKTAMAHTALINDIHKTAAYRQFDKASVVLNTEKNALYVPGLYERISRAYDEARLLSELE